MHSKSSLQYFHFQFALPENEYTSTKIIFLVVFYSSLYENNTDNVNSNLDNNICVSDKQWVL
jgi:hypothetical protein